MEFYSGPGEITFWPAYTYLKLKEDELYENDKSNCTTR